jgi:hypothetical protein
MTMKKKRLPIAFTADNILALIDFRKWATRRVIPFDKPDQWYLQDVSRDPTLMDTETGEPFTMPGYVATFEHVELGEVWKNVKSPYGGPGDGLWVREGYQFYGSAPGRRCEGIYTADESHWCTILTPQEWEKWTKRKYPLRKTPGRFMYRSLARLEPDILSISVERLHDMTGDDITAEGIPLGYFQSLGVSDARARRLQLEAWSRLWDSINAKPGRCYDDNPWVFAIVLARSTITPAITHKENAERML